MGLLALVMLMTSVSLLFAQRAQSPALSQSNPDSLPVLGQVSDFELTAATNRPFLSRNMAGKVWVVDFIFTSCAGICPVMSTAMGNLQRAFDGEDRVQFVSISVDPETDTTDVLSEYGERYGANPQRWHFLTGDIDDIHPLATNTFKVGSLDDPLIHSPHFVLIDGAGQIRGYYVGTDNEDVATLAEDIGKLVVELIAIDRAKKAGQR